MLRTGLVSVMLHLCRGVPSNFSFLQQKKAHGTVAFPNIKLYYYMALLETMVQWWNIENIVSWEMEQNRMELRLAEWVLTAKEQTLPNN